MSLKLERGSKEPFYTDEENREKIERMKVFLMLFPI